MCVVMYVEFRCPWRPKESTRQRRASVIGDFDLPDTDAGNQTCPLQNDMPFESPSQSPVFIFLPDAAFVH